MHELYRSRAGAYLSDSLFDVSIFPGEIWEFLGIKPNGYSLKRGNITITVSAEIFSNYFEKA